MLHFACAVHRVCQITPLQIIKFFLSLAFFALVPFVLVPSSSLLFYQGQGILCTSIEGLCATLLYSPWHFKKWGWESNSVLSSISSTVSKNGLSSLVTFGHKWIAFELNLKTGLLEVLIDWISTIQSVDPRKVYPTMLFFLHHLSAISSTTSKTSLDESAPWVMSWAGTLVSMLIVGDSTNLMDMNYL